MKSIKSVYKIGSGPSSSHTVGPYRAAKLFAKRYPDADLYRVVLFGSLAFTGEGHGTGKAIRSALPNAEITFNREEKNLPHPNTMLFTAIKDGKEIGKNDEDIQQRVVDEQDRGDQDGGEEHDGHVPAPEQDAGDQKAGPEERKVI